MEFWAKWCEGSLSIYGVAIFKCLAASDLWCEILGRVGKYDEGIKKWKITNEEDQETHQ